MVTRDKLPKIADSVREAQYGYVYGVSGPGMCTSNVFYWLRKLNCFYSRCCQSYGGFSNQ
jgi:hypothetical protein